MTTVEKAQARYLEGISDTFKDTAKIFEDQSLKRLFSKVADGEEISKDEINTLKEVQSKVGRFKDALASSIIKAGQAIHSNSSAFDTTKISKAIENFKYDLEEEDFDPVVITHFLASQKNLPNTNALSYAELNVFVAKKLETESISSAKLALLNLAPQALILHKNLREDKNFAQVYQGRNDIVLSQSNLMEIMVKMKNYKEVQEHNMELVCNTCNILYRDFDRSEVYGKLNTIKNIALNKTFSSISDSPSYILTAEEFHLLPDALSPDEAFLQFGAYYLELELPDPEGKLKMEMDKIEHKVSNKLYKVDFEQTAQRSTSFAQSELKL